MNLLLKLLALLAAGWVLAGALLYLMQAKLIFYPQPPGPDPGNAAARPFSLERPGAPLHGWVVNAEATGPLLVYFGGNAEEVSRLVDTFAALPATTVLMNYRGYGHSGGSPAAQALIGDARALVAEAQQRFGNGRPLLLFGRSLGSGLAALAAQNHEAEGVILMSPYRSLNHLARRFAPGMPVDWLLRHRIDTIGALSDLPERVLVLYATDDLIIPAAESRALMEMIEPPPRVETFDGGHNMPLRTPRIWQAVKRFVESAT